MRKFKKIITITLMFALIFSWNVLAEQYQGTPPEKFNQAPELEEMVNDGTLPPVEERLPVPEDVYVVEPNQEIGVYGGILKTTTKSPEGYGDDTILSTFGSPVKPSPYATELVPEVAKKLTHSDDNTTWTMQLRKGLKWSDGEAFTADDIMFWYEDVVHNEELTPVISSGWKAAGEVVQVEKIDDYTVQFKFKAPKPYFGSRLITTWIFTPKHFLKEYHPNYTSEAELMEKVEENGFDQWYQLFEDKNATNWGLPINKDRPTLGTYILVNKSSDRRVYERNPYYWKVDTAGNQLPYIDRIETEIVSNNEVIQGMIMSGEVDFAGMQADIRNYPMYKKYEEQGGFNTLLWQSVGSNEVVYFLNQTHEDPVLREIFQDVRFRRALSLGIDRNEINETLYFGKAEPRQYTAPDESVFYDSEFESAYIEYDPERAQALLEEMGLEDTNGDGWLERPDGETLSFTVEYFAIETPKQPNVELVSQHWQELGINVKSRAISGELQGQRAPANLMDATLWHGANSTDVHFPIYNFYIIPIQPSWEHSQWPEWARWFVSEGSEGMEPPALVKDIREWYEQMLIEPSQEKREELGRKIFKAQAENLWCIGTVGEAPYPLVIDKDLRNFPEEGLWVWDSKWLSSRDPSQLFFEGGSNQE